MSNDGATAVADDRDHSPEKLAECMGKFAHKWQWVWHGQEWTQHRRCMTCDEIQGPDGMILTPGKPYPNEATPSA